MGDRGSRLDCSESTKKVVQYLDFFVKKYRSICCREQQGEKIGSALKTRAGGLGGGRGKATVTSENGLLGRLSGCGCSGEGLQGSLLTKDRCFHETMG